MQGLDSSRTYYNSVYDMIISRLATNSHDRFYELYAPSIAAVASRPSTIYATASPLSLRSSPADT